MSSPRVPANSLPSSPLALCLALPSRPSWLGLARVPRFPYSHCPFNFISEHSPSTTLMVRAVSPLLLTLREYTPLATSIPHHPWCVLAFHSGCLLGLSRRRLPWRLAVALWWQLRIYNPVFPAVLPTSPSSSSQCKTTHRQLLSGRFTSTVPLQDK